MYTGQHLSAAPGLPSPPPPCLPPPPPPPIPLVPLEPSPDGLIAQKLSSQALVRKAQPKGPCANSLLYLVAPIIPRDGQDDDSHFTDKETEALTAPDHRGY